MKKELKILLLILSILCCIGLIYIAVIFQINITSLLDNSTNGFNWKEFIKYTFISGSACASTIIIIVFNVFNFLNKIGKHKNM